MPTLDARISDSSFSDIFSKNEGAPLLMSVTESNSFGSATIPQADLDGPELSLSLSGSSDSMGFDLKGSFEVNDYHKETLKNIPSGSHDEMDSNTSVMSVGTKETSSTCSVTNESTASRPQYPFPRASYGAPPPSYGRPPYPPHQPPYPHSYYGGHYPGGQPPFPGSQPPSNYLNYYRPYPPHPGYPPHSSYMQHPLRPQSNKENNKNSSNKSITSSRQPGIKMSSSASSTTSTESKKRTIDDVTRGSQADFTIHRGGSSVCSAGTSTSANPISKLVCESPVKRERIDPPPVSSLERTSSMESTESSLTFGGLSMTSHSHDQDQVTRDRQPHEVKQQSQGKPTYRSNPTVDHGVTPISKNTNPNNRRSAFFFKSESDMAPSGRIDTASPDFSLNIDTQLSWNIVGDDLAETPVSLGSNISPTFWKSDGKSPSDKNLFDDSSPVSLADGLLGGASNSPIAVFFNAPQAIQSSEKVEILPLHMEKQNVENHPALPTPTPSTPMPLQSPYYQGPPTPHVNMRMYENQDENYNQMNNGRRDGPPSYQSPRPMYRPPERIVNLRGHRMPNGGPHAPPSMHLPPHIPSHHHFMASPIGVGGPAPRNMMGLSSPHHPAMRSPYPQPSPHSNMSKRRCMPLKQPIPSKFQGDIEKYKNASIPEFTALVNFPSHMSQKQAVNLPEGMRCCVMCGQACRCSGSKGKKGAKKEEMTRKVNGQYAMIPTQNKGLCTQCDVNVWVVANSQLEIKWCKGCKNFRPWAAFGEKGLATKCVRCRDRQREKYAAQKEEKDKKKASKNRT